MKTIQKIKAYVRSLAPQIFGGVQKSNAWIYQAFTLRFKIKLFAKGATEPSPIGGSPITKVDYTWGTSTVFIKVEKKDDGPLRSIIFMVDPPPYLVKKVQTATTRQLVNPFFIYSIMVSDATQRFEKSIWELRDVIRDQEKV